MGKSAHSIRGRTLTIGPVSSFSGDTSMRTLLSAMGMILLGTLIGCGQSVVVDSPVPASGEQHGGILVPLTDNQLTVELLNGDRLKKGNSFETTLVAYVLQSDRKTPASETPTSVEVKVGTPKGDEVVPLKSAPDSADPLGSTRFISKPGPFQLEQVGGEVTVQMGGKTLSGKFRGPR